jgi:ABC-type nitrate/sulfonate/bicarbonate transport system permease component
MLWFHAGISLQRVFLGLGAAVVGGIALGTMMARSRWCEMLFEPFFIFTFPVPRITLYPIFVFVLGFGDSSKIALVFLECLYPVTLQTFYGMRSAERVLVWAARNMGASGKQLFWRVLVPSAAPSIFAGIRIALPVAFILTIVTEIIGESRGLGFLIAFASSSYEYAQAMAVLFVTGVIGFVFDRILIASQRKLIYWQRATLSLM